MRSFKDLDAANESLDDSQIFEIENKSEGSDDGNEGNNVSIEMKDKNYFNL
jgi:hypothetical protein